MGLVLRCLSQGLSHCYLGSKLFPFCKHLLEKLTFFNCKTPEECQGTAKGNMAFVLTNAGRYTAVTRKVACSALSWGHWATSDSLEAPCWLPCNLPWPGGSFRCKVLGHLHRPPVAVSEDRGLAACLGDLLAREEEGHLLLQRPCREEKNRSRLGFGLLGICFHQAGSYACPGLFQGPEHCPDPDQMSALGCGEDVSLETPRGGQSSGRQLLSVRASA